MATQQAKNKAGERMFRSPTLQTVKMVEEAISEHSGECTKTELWRRLPRKVMWPTYLTILDYLEETNRIITSDNGIITYIWDPVGVKKYLWRSLRYVRK